MKRLIALVPLVVVLTALVLLGVADTPIPSSEAVSRANEVANPDSANATITIIMRTAPLPEE